MSVRIAAAVVTLSLSLAPGALADTGATGAAGPATLSVEGNGSVFVTPDVASLSLTVSRTAPTSRRALGADNLRVRIIVGAIRALGVPATGIQTESINVAGGTVRIGPKGHKHSVKQFTASDMLQVTTTAALVGQVVDTATAKGADSINGPNFSFSNPSAGVVAANAAALTDARQQADAAAAAVGYVVTGVQSIDLDPNSGVVVAGSTGTALSAAPVAAPKTTPTTIHPGAQEVDAEVAVVYTISPAS